VLVADVSLEIPRRLNDPPRIFWWELDVALLALAAALAGMISGFFMSGCAVGVLLASAYGRAKSGKHPAFRAPPALLAPASGRTGLKRTPPSHLREMVG
jgi:conjugal transfer pilus assembly protein TraL